MLWLLHHFLMQLLFFQDFFTAMYGRILGLISKFFLHTVEVNSIYQSTEMCIYYYYYLNKVGIAKTKNWILYFLLVWKMVGFEISVLFFLNG